MKPATIERLDISAYTIPTDGPEADGTLSWNSTTLVVVHVHAGGGHGLGYTYADEAAAKVVEGKLAKVVLGCDAMAVAATWQAMRGEIRNLGQRGIAMMAVSAVDTALWDLKARLLDVPLFVLLGAVRDAIPVYGSGGFTSYSLDRLQKQLGGWVADGISRVKMKIGSHAAQDVERVRAARAAIGPDAELFVDANGAYARKLALAKAEAFSEHGVSWFEEPVSSDDLEGLRLLRDRAPAGMDITAGEYGYDPFYFRRMLEAEAVDVLQPDGTRCGGVTGFMQAGALCESFGIPVSAHTSPSLHAHTCCAVPKARHLEYFHDHARIEQTLFDGAQVPVRGELRPNRQRPGLGLELKEREAAQFRVGSASRRV
ncbi:MAG TPA: enolase C-terminal domain-like protein [Alphaproteobacteria bacterium]|nr:enolase C-terminal domain-like protein [Alphaproteobacteria bacterium]